MNDVIFSIETNLMKNNKRIQTCVPDENGIYKGIPVAVLSDNVVTYNGTLYRSDALKNSMLDPNGLFNIRLKNGDLFGEYDHRELPSMNPKDPKVLKLLFKLDPERKAAHYFRFYADRDTDLGLEMIYADLKPMGPYGKYAKELLDDPFANFSSSLRALSTESIINGVNVRDIVKLITFDVCVPTGGYKYASKRYMRISKENMRDFLSIEGLHSIAENEHVVSYETILTNTELNDIFKLNRIQLYQKINAIQLDKDIYYLQDEHKDVSSFNISRKLL